MFLSLHMGDGAALADLEARAEAAEHRLTVLEKRMHNPPEPSIDLQTLYNIRAALVVAKQEQEAGESERMKVCAACLGHVSGDVRQGSAKMCCYEQPSPATRGWGS